AGGGGPERRRGSWSGSRSGLGRVASREPPFRALGVLCTPFAAGALLLRVVGFGVACAGFVGASVPGPGRAAHALRSGGAAPTGGGCGVGLRWFCGSPRPGGEGVGPGACCERRTQRGRCSYSSGVGSLSLLRRPRDRREEG